MYTFYNLNKFADHLGVSQEAVLAAIEASKTKHWTNEECELLLKGRESGESFNDLATQLGRPASAVRAKFYRIRADWDFDPQLYGQHLGALQAKVDYTRVFRDFYGTKEAEAYVDKHSKAKRSN